MLVSSVYYILEANVKRSITEWMCRREGKQLTRFESRFQRDENKMDWLSRTNKYDREFIQNFLQEVLREEIIKET
jgi:hypothetical protein